MLLLIHLYMIFIFFLRILGNQYMFWLLYTNGIIFQVDFRNDFVPNFMFINFFFNNIHEHKHTAYVIHSLL